MFRGAVRRSHPSLVRAGALGSGRSGGSVAAAGGDRGAEQGPYGDSPGEREPGQAGEIHDPDRCVFRVVSGSSADRGGVLPV